MKRRLINEHLRGRRCSRCKGISKIGFGWYDDKHQKPRVFWCMRCVQQFRKEVGYTTNWMILIDNMVKE